MAESRRSDARAPWVSVVMPTYDRAYVLWRAIQSVVAQSCPAWELIVVDDGSTDCTPRLVEEFLDPRIRYVRADHGGASAARNRGIAVARAPFVAYLDSDNTWHPTFLSRMREAVDEHPEAVLWHCGSNVTFWDRTADGQWTLLRKEQQRPSRIDEPTLWRLHFADTNTIVHRREVATAVNGWDERCHWLEDWDFCLRVFRAFPGRLHVVPEVLVEYRQVHGAGADGVCAEARADGHREANARRYLLDKWGDTPGFAAHEKLSRAVADLKPARAYQR